jgi:hypothetical protein
MQLEIPLSRKWRVEIPLSRKWRVEISLSRKWRVEIPLSRKRRVEISLIGLMILRRKVVVQICTNFLSIINIKYIYNLKPYLTISVKDIDT